MKHYNISEKKIILLYNKPWHMKQEEDYNFELERDFFLTSEHRYLNDAVAIIFHMPQISELEFERIMKLKNQKQLWIFWSMECEHHYSWQYTSTILAHFEINATYKLDSDVPLLYITPKYEKDLRNKPIKKTAFINAFISSAFDLSGRQNILSYLMEYLKIDSFGSIFKNKHLLDDQGEKSKLDIISSYKFTIAFENAIAKDYVTEKLYQPLLAGSVPIYLGAPNVDEFLPGKNCIINVDSFSSKKSLVDFLLELQNNEEEYMKFLLWKEDPFNSIFLEKIKKVSSYPIQRLCEVIDQKLTERAF